MIVLYPSTIDLIIVCYAWGSKAGFAEAAVCRVGYRMGAGQPHSAKIAAYKSVYMGIIVAVLSTGGLFLISAYLPVWLTPDPTLQRMIFDCLPLVCKFAS